MAQERQAAIDRLYAVPLEEFVAERKRAAASLRKAGDRDAAAEVAGWPKPSAPAWALNALVREEADAARAWLAAADALREASTGGGGDLRATMAEHRDATVRLVEAAGGRAELSAPMRERVRALLQAATMDAAMADALRAGRIVEGRDGEPEPPAVEAPAAAPAKASRAEAKREAAEREAAESAEREVAEAAEHAHRIEEAAAEAQRLRAEADERAEAVAAAGERLDEAERTLRRARSERDAARDAAKEADRAAVRAERDLEKLRR